MKDLRTLNAFRDRAWEMRSAGFPGDSECGCFVIQRQFVFLRVIASVGEGWDHVSVSTNYRCPVWMEMEHIKRVFFRDDETAMQLHVPPSEHRSFHPFCLHLWRPHGVEIPRPPFELLGISTKVAP